MPSQDTDPKLVLVRRETRLEGLISRFNTANQARFAVESQGQDFEDYQSEHDQYHRSLDQTRHQLSKMGRLQEVDRKFLPNFIFGQSDLVFALGQDGLVANILKYLDGQPLFGINPDPKVWDGILLPFNPEQLGSSLDLYFKRKLSTKEVSMAEAQLNDGQKIRAVNDLFIGRKSHVSSRYSIEHEGQREKQSSSGIIVSTGLGSTGWFKSLMTGANMVASGFSHKPPPSKQEYSFPWNSPFLYFTVREPFPSRHSSTNLVFGKIDLQNPLKVFSETPEEGIIFSDGVEVDALQFNSGAEVTISLAQTKGTIVAHQ